jgi:hypothetical protein
MKKPDDTPTSPGAASANESESESTPLSPHGDLTDGTTRNTHQTNPAATSDALWPPGADGPSVSPQIPSTMPRGEDDEETIKGSRDFHDIPRR